MFSKYSGVSHSPSTGSKRSVAALNPGGFPGGFGADAIRSDGLNEESGEPCARPELIPTDV